MPLRKAEITKHAWARFVSRWEGERPLCYRHALLELLATAKEENLGYGTAVRLLKNGMQPARYFRIGNWRFVTDEEVTRIMTIEHSLFETRKPKRKGRHKKKHQR